MGNTYRQWPMMTVLALLFIIGTAVLLYSGYSGVEKNRQSIDLKQVQELLYSSDRMAEYRLIPESVMTGLCWANADGAKEGLFKDVNAGMAHWREQEPSMPADAGTVATGASTAAEDGIDYALLSNELDQLSFVATEYRYNIKTAEITGILTIADNSRRVSLTVVLPENASGHKQKDRIEITASTVIKPTDFGDALTAAADEPIGLCIAMQAAKEQVLPDLSSDQSLMLSHYY